MQAAQFNQSMVDFIQASPTPYHAVHEMRKQLSENGFELLDEGEAWQLQAGKRYMVSRNDSSLIAFVYGKQSMVENGLRMVGAHTDSPCLRVKPNSDVFSAGYWQVGVEVYGGVLLAPWFDRELGLAGRVAVLDVHGDLHHVLIDFKKAVGMIPSLAIHLDREVNKNRSINPQKELPVLLGLARNKKDDELLTFVLHQVEEQYPDIDIMKLLDVELSFYDMQPGSIYGMHQEFIASARLDNLLSCFAGLQAVLSADGEQSCLFVATDHEEVGSASNAGADGNFLSSFLQRVLTTQEAFSRVMYRSMLISADNAHGVHPNYSEKHDANHGPLLNAGPVIKVNANQRYASNSETQSIFRLLCESNNIPVQNFVVRCDMACGSTIGPIVASNLGVRTIDVGVPTFAMHSIRETAGAKDAFYLYQAVKAFNALPKV